MTRLKRFGLAAAALLGAASLAGYVYAATSLTTRLQVNLVGTLTNPLDLVTAQAPLSSLNTISLTNGVAANQADQIWSDTRSLATGTTEDIDLQGALTDAFGAAFTPAKVKIVIIKSAATNTTNLTLFGDANGVPILADASDKVVLKPGGIFAVADPTLAGYAVTAATGDIIQVENAAGATASYNIMIVGTSS